MNTLETVIKERRSALKFLPEVKISTEELDEMFNLVKYAPSCFNLQHTHYIVINEPELLDKAYEASYKQYKVKSASAAILVLGDTQAHKEAGRLYEGMMHLGILSKQEYDHMVADTIEFYEQRGDSFLHDEAIRNASLSAMQFMLIAQDKGWNTCPMIGFDSDQMMELLQVPDRYVPAMLIAIGKEDQSKLRTRGYRKPVREFVSYNHI
ncbi:nitroreductase family protein [Paenibacillus aquistagni]|uniref:nitroreductase family protein n=1 Tax=Paenibacillus aquistagni TaxID=1852522 RepID=UPI00145ADC64|nr:nitroreductase family protein [Paenibacillus aquistagni]NMM53467.1 nitroreductase family protein [Paenibacillus aquistagni]